MLLTVLVILAIVWAVFCRRRYVRSQDKDELSVSEDSASKRDVPCSYSHTDINSLGISVNDYLNPPPAYLDLLTGNLQYLDLEQGHNRLAGVHAEAECGLV